MIANIEKVEQHYIATIERHMNHPAKNVWAWLTENEKLKQWFPELRVGKLEHDGFMTFQLSEEDVKELEIYTFKEGSLLEFDWWGNNVRFELVNEQGGSRIMFVQKITELTDQTAKDLAGWHTCLLDIDALMGGRTISRTENWQKWYEQYDKAIKELT